MNLGKEYNTKARNFILNFLENNAQKTVSVSEVMDFLHSKDISVNTTTVYRFLNKLNSQKKVIKVTDKKGKRATYQLIGQKKSCNEHIHIQCVSCGKLEHIECEFMKQIREHILEEHGFQIKCEGSVLYGICSDCKNK